MKNISELKDQLITLAETVVAVDALWLYGSHAKRDASDNSDIDLAVIYNTSIEDVLGRRLRPQLLALSWIELLKLPKNSLSVLDMEMWRFLLQWGFCKRGCC